MKTFGGLLFVLCASCSPLVADSLVNAWTNPVSANWEDPKWSLGVLPGPGQSIMLTNQGWKAVAIGPNTVENLSETLNVDSVILGGYTDSFNVLLLNYAGFAVPLTAGSLNVGTNSGVTALASVLDVSTNSGPGDISIFSAFNQGGYATVNAHVINLGNVTNAAASPGTYNQTNGTINADAVSGWMGSTFNQFDGLDTIAGALSLGGANGNNVAHYSITSGWLSAGTIELQRGDFKIANPVVAPPNSSSFSICRSCSPQWSFFLIRLLDLMDVDLPHLHHRLHDVFRLGRIFVVQIIEENRGADLPSNAEFVSQPAAGDFLTTR